ncbi:non-heme iron oxygenase ferredoxin subunit [Corynebacterium nuruki]|uniref:non-heme iron oxygenase ferredoxin subunit n=1 Tax=Corynebacterium nuruki TaxID=1032851 RepID=UPI0002485DF9|nr:non-heme iron oxygenase ferredoxin subunit [Corynebacterium nuruki]
MNTMTSQSIVVAHVGDVDEDEGIVIDAAVTGTVGDIALFFDGATYYALDDTCTHETASLADGWVEDGCVECPLHAAKFCLGDGSVQSMPATESVAAHTVVVDGDDIRIIPNPDRLVK